MYIPFKMQILKVGRVASPQYLPVSRPPPQPTGWWPFLGSLSYWLHFHVNFMLIFPKVHFEKVFGYVL